MSDLKLKVKPLRPFNFVPGELTIRVISTDMKNQTAQIYFELSDVEPFDTNLYQTFQFQSRGNVTVPLGVISNVMAGGELNRDFVNQFLQNFIIELDEQDNGTESAGV